MDYKDFKPTYAYRHFLVDEMKLGADEHWKPKVLQTHLKIEKLHDVIYDEMGRESWLDWVLLTKIRDLKSKVGMWVIERNDKPFNLPGNSQTSDLMFIPGQVRQNLITDSEWEPIVHYDSFEGIPHSLWLYQGVMIVLPSKETIQWLNHLASLYSSKQMPQQF